MRILHLPTNIADQPGVLVRRMRSLGADAQLWEYGDSPFDFPRDRTIDVAAKDASVLWDAFLEAVERFDVFHFWFARSFFPNGWGGIPPYWDLPVLRMLGKKIFFTFVGSDCRTPDVHALKNPWSHRFFEEFTPDVDKILKSLNVIRMYADEQFVMSAELAPYVPNAKYQPRAFPLDEWEELPVAQRDVPHVIHVPSRRSLKGTSAILAALDRLAADGVKFDFHVVEGVAHAEVQKFVREADVVIDNVFMGDHGIVSTEAMASSRVAVAYLNDDVVATEPECPVYNVNPDSLAADLKKLFEDRDLRTRLAARGRPYVAKQFDAGDVARMLLERYEQPAAPPSTRTFPDWTGFGGQRKVEQLEERLAEVETLRSRAVAAAELRHTQLVAAQKALAEAQRRTLASTLRRAVRRLRRR